MPLASLFTETMLYSEPDELRATVTEQQVQAFITKLYALFTGNLLLVNLFTLLFVIQPGLVSWLLTSGRVFRFGITLIAFISAVVVYTKQYERKSRNQIAILE
ncbi:hypothetical protein GGF46_004931 [Coemansia sp. RSA 552]|nr:hypothetical protein GGF46_004931 [Coemansia sp. RSA 552]